MIWIEHSPHAGREMAGAHPFLVLSPRAFNQKTGLVIGCAMTSRQAHNPFAVPNPKDPAQASYILADQPKSFDWRKRRARRHPWGSVAPSVLQDVCDRLEAIIQLTR
ncbi:MAG: type II toxin-antitoxin system PemK/MazF family toxin [Burkholderiales bacterium]|nr:type II toxin-antitoxin system PemK/MazF family toxin [Burkholderiales bacterium]